jgi:hypothetical protein
MTTNLPAFVQEFTDLPKPSDYRELVVMPCPKFRQFAAKHGEASTITLITMILTEVAGLMRFTVTGDMITAAAEIIYQEWPDTKMSDLHLFKRKVLSGAIGGKLFGNDTRTMCELWREYYSTREDVFADDREAKYIEEKKSYQEGWDKLMGSMPEKYKALRKIEEDKRSLKVYQANASKLTLEGLCREYGVSYDRLVQNARADCLEQIKAQNSEVDLEWYLGFHLKSVLQHVRKSYENLMAYNE